MLFLYRGKKAVFATYAVFLLVLLFPLYAFSASFVDIIVKQRVIVAQSRGIVTLPFSVVNRSNRTLRLRESLELPEGWRILTGEDSFTLAAGERSLRLLHVLASSDVPAGKYTIPYQIVSRDKFSIHAEKKISVIIKSASKLSVEVIEKPDLVLAGEKYTVKVQLANQGNVPLLLGVDVRDRLSYLTSFAPHHLQLKASQKAIITIHAKIPETLSKSTYHNLKLLLKGRSIAESKSIKTQIIAFKPDGTGLYQTIPTKITSTYTNNGDHGVLQTELSAAGNLDEKGKHHLDLLYRDTKTNDLSVLGSDAEKRLSYNNDSFAIHLGDRSFSLAGIGDEGLYGKGVEVDYSPPGKKWNIRAFTAEQKRQDNTDNVNKDSARKFNFSGFEIGYKFSNELELAINTLSQRNNDKEQKKESISGIDLHWDKFSSAEVNLSLAKDKDGKAFRLQQYGSLGDFNYDLEVQKADADFDGLIKDIKSEAVTGIYSFNDNKNYLRTNLYHAKRNVDEDTSRNITEDKNFSLGIGHYFNNLHQDSLYTEIFVRKSRDLRQLSDYNQTERGIRLDYQKNINQQLRLNTIVEHVLNNDHIRNKKSAKNRGSLTLAYTPNDKYHLSLNIDSSSIHRDNSVYDNDSNYDDNSLNYGLNAAIRFNSRQLLSGYWRHSKNNNTLQLNYNHTFNNGITLGGSVSTDTLNNSKTDKDSLEYQLRLSVPFDMPLYKYKNIAALKGKVYDKAQRQPVSNAIVAIAGQYAVTDKEGNYLFKAIREGKYDLSTNLSKTRLNNYMIENNEQQKITLHANRTLTHNIKLVAGTGISGQVLAYTLSSASILSGKANHTAMKPSGGVEGLLVTLVSTDDSEIVHKALTSEGGYFSFNGIKAGKWLIQVTDPRKVLKDARLEKPQRVIELKVGKDTDIVFRAIPLMKQIRKIGPSSGFNVIGE